MEKEIPKRKSGESIPPRIDPVKVAARTYSPKEGIPPVWKSALMKKRIHKVTERVEAETNLMRKLQDYLQYRNHLSETAEKKDAHRKARH
jgi:hypothetical protein